MAVCHHVCPESTPPLFLLDEPQRLVPFFSSTISKEDFFPFFRCSALRKDAKRHSILPFPQSGPWLSGRSKAAHLAPPPPQTLQRTRWCWGKPTLVSYHVILTPLPSNQVVPDLFNISRHFWFKLRIFQYVTQRFFTFPPLFQLAGASDLLLWNDEKGRFPCGASFSALAEPFFCAATCHAVCDTLFPFLTPPLKPDSAATPRISFLIITFCLCFI